MKKSHAKDSVKGGKVEMKNKDDSVVTLKISETNPKFVGRGVALVDPKVMEDLNLSTGDVIEIRGRKKSYVLLWSSQPTDYGNGLIRVDGYTRNNIGVGIDDRVTIQKVSDIKKAEQIILSPTEELNIVGLEEHLPGLLEGRVIAKGDMIPLNIMGRKIGFVITSISPSSDAASASWLTVVLQSSLLDQYPTQLQRKVLPRG